MRSSRSYFSVNVHVDTNNMVLFLKQLLGIRYGVLIDKTPTVMEIKIKNIIF